MENKKEELNNLNEKNEREVSSVEKEVPIEEKEVNELIEMATDKNFEEEEIAKTELGKRGFEELKDLKRAKEELLNKKNNGSISDLELVKLKQVNRKIEIVSKSPYIKEMLKIEEKNEEAKEKEDISEYHFKFGDEVVEKREEIKEEVESLKKEIDEYINLLKEGEKNFEERNNLINEQLELEEKQKRILKILEKEGVLELFEWKDKEDRIEEAKKFEKKREKVVKELEKEGAEWVEVEEGSGKGYRLEVTDDQIKKAEKEMQKDFKERREGSKGQKFLLKAATAPAFILKVFGYSIQAFGYVWGKIWEGVDMINKRFGGKSFWK